MPVPASDGSWRSTSRPGATRLPRPRAMPTIWKVSSRKRPPRGHRIVAAPCDVTDEKQMDRTVTWIEKEAGPIALAIFNAGTYSPTHGERLETDNFIHTFRVNVFGVVFGLVPVVDRYA